MNQTDQGEMRNRIVTEAFQCRRALEVYAFSMLKDRVEAEDIVQDAFLVVMAKFEEFEEGSSMLAWTRAIVRFKVLQLLEKRNRRSQILDNLLHDAVDAAFGEVETKQYADEVRERGLRLQGCLASLGKRPRLLLKHVYTDGMSYQSAADSVGMKVEAVKKSLQRAKAHLRECVQQTQIDSAV